MIVSSDQMRVLAEDVRRRFELRSVAMLRRAFPQSTQRHPDDTLRLFVRHGIERARLAGLNTVADVERWLRLMMRLGAYFDVDERWPEVRTALLGNLELHGPLRLDAAEALAARLAPESK